MGAYYIGVLNAAVISGFNSVYRQLSQRLTNWENHRTDR